MFLREDDFDRDRFEKNILQGGTVMLTHKKENCKGEFCTIHNRSNHHMLEWPQYWRSDRLIMEIICPHGVGHPDPDGIFNEWDGIHGCCPEGCCVPPLPGNIDI